MQTLLLVFFTVAFLPLSRPAHPQTLEEPSARQAAFVLTIEDALISLNAQEVSLKAILEEIGRRMNVQVKVEIPAAANVTLAFERLPLPEVLQRLGKYVNYDHVEYWEQGELRLTTITVHSLKIPSLSAGPGMDASRARQEERHTDPLPKALEVEIDPARYLREKRQ